MHPVLGPIEAVVAPAPANPSCHWSSRARSSSPRRCSSASPSSLIAAEPSRCGESPCRPLFHSFLPLFRMRLLAVASSCGRVASRHCTPLSSLPLHQPRPYVSLSRRVLAPRPNPSQNRDQNHEFVIRWRTLCHSPSSTTVSCCRRRRRRPPKPPESLANVGSGSDDPD